MSGVATKKSGADTAVQLTYPAVFQQVYANENIPQMFEPEMRVVGEMPLIGEDLQSRVHLQRKRDADAMAMAKVHSTRMMNLRSLTGHAGYHLPPPVLGQRRFANPSNGAYFPYSSRQDYRDAPFNYEGEGYEGRGLEGGVLRTAQGQAYGKAKLLDRIRQLNAISAAKSAFVGALPVGVPAVGGPTTTAPMEGVPTAKPSIEPLRETAKIELAQLLQFIDQTLMFVPPSREEEELYDAFPASVIGEEGIEAPKPKFPNLVSAYKESIRSLQLIIRVATSAQGGDDLKYLVEIQRAVLQIIFKLGAYKDSDYNLQEKNPVDYFKVLQMSEYWLKVQRYIEEMVEPRVYNMSPLDKQTASKTLLKSLNFGKVWTSPTDLRSIGRRREAEELDRYAFRDSTDSSGRSTGFSSGGGDSVARAYADDWDGDGGFDGRQEWRNAPAFANRDRFSRSGASREDTEHSLPSDFSPPIRAMARMGRAGFDPSMREAFGYASGDWFPTGGRPMGFFGEAPETYGEAPNLAEARDSAYQAGLLAQQTRDRILSAQARARGEQGTNTATTNAGALSGLGSYKDPETGEYDVKMKTEGVRKGKGNGKVVKFSMTRKDLPTTLDGFKQLALDVEKKGGGKIRINKNSTLKNVRRNFIKRLGL